MSRPEAIRRLLGRALAGERGTHSSTKNNTARTASDMAADAVERVSDKSVPVEEQARRQRVLIKGPKEFREDQPKPRK